MNNKKYQDYLKIHKQLIIKIKERTEYIKNGSKENGSEGLILFDELDQIDLKILELIKTKLTK